MLKLVNKETDKSIPAKSLERGQLAVITSWSYDGGFVGNIVQRWYNDLIIVGSHNGWSGFFVDGTCSPNSTCRVRVLETGENLIIESGTK